ncbi:MULTISPECIES: hypothetical protein [Acinetobacter]|uniref:Uncharacterized protein n=1 Tax=Acinetobacter indicus TaxID=756892 RepID=A0A6C0Y6S9_9GAMM|nr:MULTISPECIES: hypothetical protein [Acinetobacter]QIC71810.1 hypothetical protein FSC09_15570 [Acinetobacter indicus]QKQ71718.1 hypothetical protein E5Y90_15930 [Acinetobacter sp. 10FS3-1]
MEIQTQLGTTVEVQPTSRAIPIFDNQIDHPATLIVDFAAYTASFAFPDKPETFRIHMEMFIEFNPDLKAPIQIQITPNIQTAKFITYNQAVVNEVNSFAQQLEQFFIVHYFENNSEQVVYNTIVEAIKSCNNPIYSIFFYERDFNVSLADKDYFLRHKV